MELTYYREREIMSNEKGSKGAVNEDHIGAEKKRAKKRNDAIDAAGDTDSAPADPNSAAWNRGRNAADPSRKKNTKVS
jgi:hypothetical protein